MRVQANPRVSSRSCSSSASALATNAAWSTRSAGGSSSADDGEVGRDGALVEQPSVVSVRESMGQGTEGTEARRDIRRRQRRELPERADTEPRQQVDEVVEAELGLDHREHGRRQRGEERRSSTRGDDAPRELGRERAVGHPDDGRAGDVDSRAQHLGCKCNDPFDQRVVSAEVARGPMRRERDRAGTGHLDARREHVERHSERLERTGIASRISGNDDEARATPLCFTSTQPLRHSLEPRRRRRRDDAVGVHDREGLVGHRARGDHRPLRTAQDQRAHRYPASARTSGVTVLAHVAITPSGPGSQSDAVRGRAALPRPVAVTVTRRDLQMPGTVIDARPLRLAHRAAHVDRQRARRADDEQHRTALAGTGGETAGVAHRHSLRRAHEHDVDRVDERGHDRRPLAALRCRHHCETVEHDPALGSCTEPEPWHPDCSHPRPLL